MKEKAQSRGRGRLSSQTVTVPTATTRQKRGKDFFTFIVYATKYEPCIISCCLTW